MQTVHFPSGSTNFYFNERFSNLQSGTEEKTIVVITDSNLFHHYQHLLKDYKTVVIPSGEKSKSWETAKHITEELVKQEVDRQHFIVGFGGGMVTDITGFAAATYMRGLEFGFVPTSLLAMVDAAIGGKNGVNINEYKNMVGTIRQPKFLLYDLEFLQTLPEEEWSNGFAEIIKYGCIFDETILHELQQNDLNFYKKNTPELQQLIEKCASWKNKTVQEDEQEKGNRKLLNFGHTVGHAIENEYQLSHGKAISIGMMVACKLSEKIAGLTTDETQVIKDILERYSLPTSLNYEAKRVLEILKMDKKRKGATIDFVLLAELGKGLIRPTTFGEIEKIL